MLVYTRYIPGLETCWYIPGIYLVYTSYIADVGLYLVYTRYIPGKVQFYRFQMTGSGGLTGTAGRTVAGCRPARRPGRTRHCRA